MPEVDAVTTIRPPPPARSTRHDRANADDHRSNVDVDRPVELIESKPEQIAAHRDARVEHCRIEAPERVECRCHRRVVRRAIGDISDNRGRSVAEDLGPLDRFAVDQHDRCASGDQAFGCRPADTGRGTGDDRNSIVHGFM